MMYILLLRGINAGKLRAIKMEKLRSLFVQLGVTSVKTYIQTGNVLFSAQSFDKKLFITKLQEIMESELDWSVPLFIYSLDEWKKIVASNPFIGKAEYTPEFLHAALIQDKEGIARKQFDFSNDHYALGKDAVYFYCPDGYRNTEFTNNDIEKKLAVFATTRRWKTIMKLLELGHELSEKYDS